MAFFNLRELYAAVKAGEKALSAAESQPESGLIGKICRDLGWYYFALGDTHLSEQMLNRFLDNLDCYPEHAPLVPEVHHNLALVHRQRRRYREAIIAHEQAASLFGQTGNKAYAMLSYRGVIVCHLLQENANAALPYIHLVADYLRFSADPNLAAHHLTDWARYWRLKGDLMTSLAFCEEALIPGRPGSDDHVHAEAALIAAENAFDLGNYAEAPMFASISLNCALNVGHPLLMNRVSAIRRRLHELPALA